MANKVVVLFKPILTVEYITLIKLGIIIQFFKTTVFFKERNGAEEKLATSSHWEGSHPAAALEDHEQPGENQAKP